MPVAKRLKITGLVVFSFVALVMLIGYLSRSAVISPQQAGLMVVALFGLYVGFGILIAVFRMISKLD